MTPRSEAIGAVWEALRPTAPQKALEYIESAMLRGDQDAVQRGLARLVELVPPPRDLALYGALDRLKIQGAGWPDRVRSWRAFARYQDYPEVMRAAEILDAVVTDIKLEGEQDGNESREASSKENSWFPERPPEGGSSRVLLEGVRPKPKRPARPRDLRQRSLLSD